MRINPDDSADLDFVLTALMVGAIDVRELRAWSDYAIARLCDPPGWLLDLSYFDDSAFHAYKIIGFVPSGSEVDTDALAAIALGRGRSIDETICSPSKARLALKRNPEAASQFRAAFPFLEV